MTPAVVCLFLVGAISAGAQVSEARPSASSPAQHTGQPDAAPDVHEIMQRAVEKDIINWQAAKDYTFLERTREDKLDDHGDVKSSKVETSEILVLYGEPFERLVSRDGKPLPPKEQKKQDEEFEKETQKRANETPEERDKRIKEYEKRRQDDRAFVHEVLDAYNFTLTGQEVLNGRKTWVIDGEPRPGFQAKHKDAKMLPKIKPRLWIDQQDYTWVKLHGEVLDTMSFGLVIARIHKGTQFDLEQTRVNDEVWLPYRVDAHVDARIALLKNFNEGVHVSYSDYRKFRTDTKILPVEGAANE